jgi:UDP-3-O-[3-hydroxymyristoyl] glucosamine N-acyltransferase
LGYLKYNRNPDRMLSYTAISDSAKIGKKCKLGYISTIGNNCRIGDNVTISDKVTIVQNTTIGNNCTIQSGVVIGADGFSYERDVHVMNLKDFLTLVELR